jgi:hypothetical protein
LHELFQQQSVGFAGGLEAARRVVRGSPGGRAGRGIMARQAFAGAVHQLATAGLGFLQDGGDVGIVVVEYFAQQEGGAPSGLRRSSSNR